MNVSIASPGWIAPGAAATLVWHEGVMARDGGAPLYQIAGPALEGHSTGPFFVLCPVGESAFAERLYQGRATLEEAGLFLGRARVVKGAVLPGSEWLAAEAEAPAAPLLTAWDALADRPLIPYEREIGAFLPGDALLRVSPEAHALAADADERFAAAWVCEECGQAEDAAVFLWTRRRGDRVRVRLLIDNQAGLWTCHLQPFDFAREAP